ncbi:MAG: GGDEF domain-containing protein [Acidobacteriota bacterium]
MLERLRNAIRPALDDKPLVRKTTEVRMEVEDPQAAVERAHQYEPALIMLEGDLPGQVFRLKSGRHVIGRRPECDIRVRERAVSGIHAEVIRVRDTVTINDLASTNGTLLNGHRIRTPMPLIQGNLLKLGNCVFKYVDSLLEVEFTEGLHARGTVDQLTGAFNQSYLVVKLGFAIDTASEGRPVSIVAFDFDNFKQVNDQYGHAAGDYVLRASSAMIMNELVRPGDLFARMGGEEFVIVLQATTVETACEIAERLRRTLEERAFVYEGKEIRLTSSFGVCFTATAIEQPEFILLRADELLYRSKREGRNRVSV